MEKTNKELQCQIENLEEKVGELESKCKGLLNLMIMAAFTMGTIIMCIIDLSQ